MIERQLSNERVQQLDMPGRLVELALPFLEYIFPLGFAATGAHLYNAHNAVGTKRVVVGEGAFDVAALKIAMDAEPALRDVVPIGPFGKHLSNSPGADDQLAKFLRLKNERWVEEVEKQFRSFLSDKDTTAIVAHLGGSVEIGAAEERPVRKAEPKRAP